MRDIKLIDILGRNPCGTARSLASDEAELRRQYERGQLNTWERPIAPELMERVRKVMEDSE